MASSFKHTEAFVRKYGDQVEKEIQNNLVSMGKVSSGKLFNSLRKRIRVDNEGIALNFFFVKPGSEYAEFVDKGVTGHGVPNGWKGKTRPVNRSKAGYKFADKMPPSRPIKSWMRIQGIPKEKEFVIRRSIWMFGIKPTLFFTKPTTRRQEQFNLGVEKALAKDFEETIKKQFAKK